MPAESKSMSIDYDVAKQEYGIKLSCVINFIPSDFACASKILSKGSLCGGASFGRTKVSNSAECLSIYSGNDTAIRDAGRIKKHGNKS